MRAHVRQSCKCTYDSHCCCALGVARRLQVIEFSELNAARLSFMKRTLTELLTTNEDALIEDIFQRVSGVKKLKLLCEGLKLFLAHFLGRGKASNETLRRKTELAEKSLDSRNYQVRM